MAHLLVWGKTRELIAGDVPAGITTQEVESLAALQAAVEAKGSALVLADPGRLDAERRARAATAARCSSASPRARKRTS
jgi:hypothetical protein